MKTPYLYICVILLFASFTVIFMQRQQFKSTFQDYEERFATDSTKMDGLKNLIFLYGEYINIPLKSNMIVNDSSGKQIKIIDLISTRKYIYHFDETNCFTCVEQYLGFVKKLSKKIGKNKVIIIGSYKNYKDLFLNLKRFDLSGISIYNIDPSALENTKIGKINTPYILSVDSLLNVSRVYIPEKALPELSEMYNDFTPLTNN